MAVEQRLTHWGVAAVFVGAMAEGESFVLAGGALAQRGLLSLWQVALAAFAGSIVMDQFCFWLGRRFRRHRWVRAIRSKPAAEKAIGFVERHPTGYILAFRYLYGLRIVSPLAIGCTHVPASRFLVLNTASAGVWAMLFAGLGYAAGDAFEHMFGRVQSAERMLLWVMLATAALAIGGAVIHGIVSRRREAAGETV